jgi:RNA-directed DNA polymerase
MTKNRESKPVPVPFVAIGDGSAKPIGASQSRWEWVNPCIWTDRMLTALENGVKGGKWFSLIDKVYADLTLLAAARKVIANGGAAGVDHVTTEMFADHQQANLERLQRELRTGTYRPQAIQRCWIPKPGSTEKRPLGIPTVRDRVVQTAVRQVLEPIFERDFAEQSYGFRPGRGCKDALQRVDDLLKAGYTYVVDADLKSYFDTIPHDRLMQRIREKITDSRGLALLEAFLKQGVMDGLREWTPEEGSPQGAVISPLLSNIYLDPLDHLMARKGYQMVRYADDFVILCRSREEAERALDEVRRWTVDAGLTLHPVKTRIADAQKMHEGFDFLGYHFERGYRWPRTKSIRKLKDTVRVKTRRTNGGSLQAIITNVNRTLQGWFGYFKHSHYTTFGRIDQWIRMRLRSVLRKRRRRRGRGRGRDHHRWPNAYFVAHGLLNLTQTHMLISQPLPR